MPTDQENLVLRFYDEVLSQGNLVAAEEIVAKDIVLHNAPRNMPQGLVGLKKWVRHLRTAFPDMEVAVEDLIVAPGKIAMRGTVSGTHLGEWLGVQPTKKRVSWIGIDILCIKDGKIVESWNVENLLSVYRQFGVPLPYTQVKT